MSQHVISGIQQIGVGIPNVHEAFKWYRQNFGLDIPILDAPGTADLMLPYTGGKPHERHAILAINIQGGGGMEIWQYISRTPEAPAFEVQLGDLGINVAKVKTRGKKGFVKDPYGNYFEMVPTDNWFKKTDHPTGGMYGCILGVSDIEKSKAFYRDILGYDTVVYEKSGVFDDLKDLPGGDHEFERVLLRHSQPRKGAFSRLLGKSEVELLKVTNRQPQKIYENRFWGDLGFIHLTFDIRGMEELKQHCEKHGAPFTVDSRKGNESFDMGEAAGHFSYIEDPDGTLIEFVETHKVPVIKKLGINLNLKNRHPEKPLPDWMVKALSFGRVKD